MSFLSHKLLPVCGLCLLALPAAAAEYTLSTFIDQLAFYDGNIVMNPISKEEVSAYQLSPRANFRVRGDRWQAGIDSTLRFTFLSNDLYDSDDQHVDLSASRNGEKSLLQFSAGIDRESTRTQVDELDDVVAATRVEQRNIRPSYTRVLNEKNSVSVGASWSDSEYVSPRYNDYENSGLDLNWVRQMTEQLDLQVTLYSSRFESGEPPFNTDSDTLGLELGLTRQFSQGLSGSFSVGTRQVDTTTRTVIFIFPITIKEKSDGFTAAANIDYRRETWSFGASVSRSLVPNGFFGGLLEADSIDLEYRRQLSTKWFFELSASATSDDALGSDDDFQRDYTRIEPRLRWRFAEQWSFTTSLRHRTRERTRGGIASDVDSLAIFFGLNYQHPRTRWSR